MIRSCLAALLLATAIPTPVSAQESGPATADSFERETLKALRSSHERKRGVVLHVDGEAIAGVVKAIGADVVVMTNQEFDTVLVRRERISAVESY